MGETYDGWSNYETWAVALWIDNERGSYDYWRGMAEEFYRAEPEPSGAVTRQEIASFRLADYLKEQIEEASPLNEASLYSNLLNAALSEVNWDEIASHYVEEIADEVDKQEAQDAVEP